MRGFPPDTTVEALLKVFSSLQPVRVEEVEEGWSNLNPLENTSLSSSSGGASTSSRMMRVILPGPKEVQLAIKSLNKKVIDAEGNIMSVIAQKKLFIPTSNNIDHMNPSVESINLDTSSINSNSKSTYTNNRMGRRKRKIDLQQRFWSEGLVIEEAPINDIGIYILCTRIYPYMLMSISIN